MDGRAESSGPQTIRSDIAWATPTRVEVHDLDLVDDVLGTTNLGDFAFLVLFRRLPDPDESVVFNALVVSLVEHGLTPNALATRLTLLGAPESLQGAVAAGLLGLGSTYVGTIEGAARLCTEEITTAQARDDDLPRLCADVVRRHRAVRALIPGLGHPVHKPVDPRAERLFAIAREHGVDTRCERFMRGLAEETARVTGKEVPVNVTGAIGSISAAVGLPWDAARGLGVMARAIGLVGHIMEERRRPLAHAVWSEAERSSVAHRSA